MSPFRRYDKDVDASKDPARGPGFRIKHCWLYASIDPADGAEGVVGIRTAEGWMPAVATDEQRRDFWRPIVQDIVKQTGLSVRLIRLSVREDIEEIKP